SEIRNSKSGSELRFNDLTNYDLTGETSLHLDLLPQISRDVEIFAFDNSRLTFFKATTVDRLELQNLLFGLHGFFRRHFFVLGKRRLFSRCTHRRLRHVESLKRVRAWFHRGLWRAFDLSEAGLFERRRLGRLKIFDRRRLGLNLDLRRGFPRLFPHWRHFRRATQWRL